VDRTPSEPGASGRVHLSLVVASIGLAAAVLAAIGPARSERTTYTWPPRSLEGAPSTAWYTPLLLVRERPDTLVARIPCSLPPALPQTGPSPTVLATARDPDARGAFEVVRDEAGAVVRSNGQELATIPPGEDGSECAYTVRLADGRWSLAGPEGAVAEGAIDAMPYVSGVFSELDLRAGTPPALELTTAVHGSDPAAWQTVAWVVAALCAVAALLLAAFGGRRPSWAVARVRLHPADAVVAVSLVAWWIVAPVFFDDGWVTARQRAFASSGGFSEYYAAFAGNQPLGYWLEWLQHWLSEATAALLVLRVPALLCLAAIWVLCRWITARAAPGSGPAVVWALACTFLVAAFSWGMTLRPEPVVALLVAGVLACTVRFRERESAAPLALAGVLVALALAAHPAGIVTFAPLLVVAPQLYGWAREQLATAAAVVLGSGALLITLAAVGADLDRRRLDAQAIGTYGSTDSWRDEILRYSSLLASGPGTPLRRLSVGLIALVVLAYVLRRRREHRPLLDLAAPALAVALVLFVATPSKWSWHFGTLIGLVAVGAACETARLLDEGRRAEGWSARPFLALGAATLVAAWSPGLRHEWMTLDLRTLEWTLGFERGLFTVPKLAALVPIAVLGGAVLLALVRGRQRVYAAPWRAAAWTAPALAVPLLVFTTGVLAADAAKTDSWTLTGQNLETLAGDLECGLADDAVVAATASMRPLPAVERRASALPPWAPEGPLEGLPLHYLDLVDGRLDDSTPWFRAPSAPVGVFVSGTPAAPSGLEVEWGRARGDEIEALSREPVSALTAPEEAVPWRFFPEGELPARPDGADALRLRLSTGASTPATLLVTAPVAYENEDLAPRLDGDSVRTLVPPHLLMYVPCVEQPVLRDGAVEVPDQIVGARDSFFPIFGQEATPFSALFDLYRIHRLPLSDSADPPGSTVLYEVDRRIPGAQVAAPEKLSES
jgi:arabinosyltransferase B